MVYLVLGIREGLRVYPPVPSGLPREVPEGGNVIMGKWLPQGTRISVHPVSAYRSPANFRYVQCISHRLFRNTYIYIYIPLELKIRVT